MQFLNFVESYCQKNNIELIVSEKKRVNCYSIECNGFFDNSMSVDLTKEHIVGAKKFSSKNFSKDTKMVLAYSKGGKTEEEILSLVAHEFGHANQYLESSELWVDSSQFLVWDDYFTNEKFKMSKVKKVWANIVKLEADCEKRVLNFIDEFNLPISKESYTQRANAYLYFYMFALKKRKWYNKAPYEIKEIVKEMPTTIYDLDFYSDQENKEIISKEKIFEACFV